MKAKIKHEWMGNIGNNKHIPCKFEKDVILSDRKGFNKRTYFGWYVRDEDLDENGIYTNYWHHAASNFLSGQLGEIDTRKCRKIIESSLGR